MDSNDLNGLLNKYKQEMSKIYNLYVSAIESYIKNRMNQSDNRNYQQPLTSNLNNTNIQRDANVKEKSIIQSNEIGTNVEDSSSFLMNNAGVRNTKNKDSGSIVQSNNSGLPVNLNINGSSSSQALFDGQASAINESYIDFLNNNDRSGSLKIQVSINRQAMPINNVLIIISKDFKDGKRIFYSERTNANGIIDNLLLPAPSKELSLNPSSILPFATYDIVASHPNYQQATFLNIPIFEGIKSIQPINLLPLQ